VKKPPSLRVDSSRTGQQRLRDARSKNWATNHRHKLKPPVPRETLSETEVKEQIQLTAGEVAALNQIAAGRPMRNAGEVIRALKLKMEFSVKKPVQEVASDQKLTVEVHTLPPLPPGDPGPNPPYIPGVTPVVLSPPPAVKEYDDDE
jgi:hypothetical protein